MKSIDELERMREERNISMTNMAMLVGYSSKSVWSMAVDRNSMSDDVRERAEAVFEYYDEHGVIPEP